MASPMSVQNGFWMLEAEELSLLISIRLETQKLPD